MAATRAAREGLLARGRRSPAQKGFADDVVSGPGRCSGQMGLTALNPPAGVAMMFGQGADTMADKTAKDPGTQKNRDLAILGSGAWTGATEWASNKFILGMEKLPGIKMLDLKTPAFSPGGADRACSSGRGAGRNSPRTSGRTGCGRR